jgi:hypothetical protein
MTILVIQKLSKNLFLPEVNRQPSIASSTFLPWFPESYHPLSITRLFRFCVNFDFGQFAIPFIPSYLAEINSDSAYESE